MRTSRVIGLIVIVAVAAALYAFRDSVNPARDAERADRTDRVDPPAAANEVAEPTSGARIPEGPAAGARKTFVSPPAPQTAADASRKPVEAPTTTEEATVEQAAHEFIETLTEAEVKPIPAAQADHFVVPEQVISLASNRVVELISRREILSDPELGPDSPITLVKAVPQIEIMTPERIIAESGGDLERPIKILEGEEVKEISVRKLLARHAADPASPISVIKLAEYLEPTTPKGLTEGKPRDWDTMVRVIRQPYRLESTTVADLLAGLQDIDPDSVFYIRTVRDTDVQGVWGIIHDGLVKNFARGMAVRRGEEVNTYKVEIPRFADELLPDLSSSFLGRLIDEKARESTVYNFELGRMTKNPHLVVPGREILIVNFRPNELVSIYKHFLSDRG